MISSKFSQHGTLLDIVFLPNPSPLFSQTTEILFTETYELLQSFVLEKIFFCCNSLPHFDLLSIIWQRSEMAFLGFPLPSTRRIDSRSGFPSRAHRLGLRLPSPPLPGGSLYSKEHHRDCHRSSVKLCGSFSRWHWCRCRDQTGWETGSSTGPWARRAGRGRAQRRHRAAALGLPLAAARRPAALPSASSRSHSRAAAWGAGGGVGGDGRPRRARAHGPQQVLGPQRHRSELRCALPADSDPTEAAGVRGDERDRAPPLRVMAPPARIPGDLLPTQAPDATSTPQPERGTRRTAAESEGSSLSVCCPCRSTTH